MATIARALYRASRYQVDIETLKTLAIFSGAGLAVSLVLAICGAELGAELF